jgi:hypothetical protein
MSSYQSCAKVGNNGQKQVVESNDLTSAAMEELDSRDPRVIDRIDVDISGHTTIDHNFQTYSYVQVGSDGKSSKKITSIFFRPEQDVIDTFLYSKSADSEYKFYLLEKLRPVLAARSKFNLSEFCANGRQINLPGFYFHEDGSASGIEGAVKEYVNNFGLEPVNSIRSLGPAYFVGSFSPELAFPKIVQVDDLNSEQKVSVKFGDNFKGQIILHKLSVEEFYNKIQSGQIADLRAIQAFYRFCNSEGITIPNQRAEAKIQSNFSLEEIKIPVLDKLEVRKRLLESVSTISEIKHKGSGLTSPDLIVFSAQAKNIHSNLPKQIAGDEYQFDVCMSRFPDSVHPIPHFIADGDVYMLLNIRQALVPILRNQVAHQIYSNDTSHRVEGIYEREQFGLDENLRANFITETLHSRWGLEVVELSDKIIEGTFSPGFDPEVGRFYCAKVDPTKPLSGEFADVTFAVKLQDIAGLIESGEIRSLETIIGYETLKNYYGIQEQQIAPNADTLQLKFELTEIFNKSSQTRKILASQHPQLYSRMMSTHSGQNVIAYILNRGPGITFAHSASDVEAGLFDGTSGISPLESKENDHEAGLLSFHDIMHAIRRDPPVKGLTLEQYSQALLERECDALWFSEVHIPSIYGYENFRDSFNKTSLGEVFTACGLTSIEQQRQAITSMVVDGIIPKQLIDHPRYFEIQWCIREKLIGYFVRDKLTNCQLLYNAKLETPNATEVLSKFYPKNPATLEEVLEYNHAVNNLKEYIVTLQSEKSSRSISKLAWLIEELSASKEESDKALLEKAWQVVNQLSEAHHQLQDLSRQITTSEVSAENIEIYRQIKQIEEGPILLADDFCKRHWHQDREFPAATVHPFFTTPEQWAEIISIEKQQLQNSANIHLSELS